MMLKKQLVALVSIAFSGILLFGCGQRRSDSHLGPAPHFTWINHGDARPAPHILRLEGPSPASGDAMERCQKRPGPAACLLRNWRTYLAALGQGELSAPPGTRSYRAVIEPACNGAIMVRLDLTAGGQATLTTVHAPNAPPGARFAELPVALGQRLWRRTASASTDDVAAVTRALRANLFDLITADPSALWIREEAYDGMTAVIEADVNGRYRYVARHSGEFNSEQVRRMADAFLALAAKRTPGFPAIHPC